MANRLPSVIFLSVLGFSLGVSLTPYLWWGSAALFLSLPLFVLSYPLAAALIASFVKKGVVRGIFPRDTNHPMYFKRRVYGICWTCVYYFKPIYFAWLSIPLLKKILFRSFGYKGHMSFTIYPDTWIRDLPLLNFGKGAYISNRATLGTNVCLMDNNITVNQITVGEGSIVGHLAMIAPAVTIGNRSEVGVGSILGFFTVVSDDVRIGGNVLIDHRVFLGAKSSVGTGAKIGRGAIIGENIKIAAAAIIPAGVKISTQAEADLYTPKTLHFPEIAKHLAETSTVIMN